MPVSSRDISKFVRIEEQLIINKDWIAFWETCDWLKEPSQEDLKTIIILEDQELIKYDIVFFLSKIAISILQASQKRNRGETILS